MPAGMSAAKARRNSKTKASGFSRAKSGAVAKAGKRRPNNIMKASDGNYVLAPFKARPKVDKVEKSGFIMTHLLPHNPPGFVVFPTY